MTEKNGFFRELTRNWMLFLMLLPAIVFFLINHYAPMIGIYYAFVRFEFNKSLFELPFIGLENFEFLWKSGKLLELTLNTIGYNLAFIVLGNALAVACAVLLSEIGGKWFKKITQSVMFLAIFHLFRHSQRHRV